ncbi:hypothetical protein N6L27_03405 [Leisingera sp. SS27]|uniref:hypothetical protein n=1 Tax=Leisingera sp. SS27 TaxID=2979462 RepID=UPI00232AFDAC|nr:hypothetical protein [Leisingera sp. SS27]MDC0657037.1 hypothetical protein [Leisingera sp. SS27]
MSSAKTVVAAGAAYPTAVAATSLATPVVPILEAPLWLWEINGSMAAVTPQQIIVGLTGVLGVAVLGRKLFSRSAK